MTRLVRLLQRFIGGLILFCVPFGLCVVGAFYVHLLWGAMLFGWRLGG